MDDKFILENLTQTDFLFKYAGIEIWQPLIEKAENGYIQSHIDLVNVQSAKYNSKEIEKRDIAMDVVYKDEKYYLRLEFINNLQSFSMAGVSLKLKNEYGDEQDLNIIEGETKHEQVDAKGVILYFDIGLFYIGNIKEYDEFILCFKESDFWIRFNGVEIQGSFDYELEEGLKFFYDDPNKDYDYLHMLIAKRLKWASEMKTAKEGSNYKGGYTGKQTKPIINSTMENNKEFSSTKNQPVVTSVNSNKSYTNQGKETIKVSSPNYIQSRSFIFEKTAQPQTVEYKGCGYSSQHENEPFVNVHEGNSMRVIEIILTDNFSISEAKGSTDISDYKKGVKILPKVLLFIDPKNGDCDLQLCIDCINGVRNYDMTKAVLEIDTLSSGKINPMKITQHQTTRKIDTGTWLEKDVYRDLVNFSITLDDLKKIKDCYSFKLRFEHYELNGDFKIKQDVLDLIMFFIEDAKSQFSGGSIDSLIVDKAYQITNKYNNQRVLVDKNRIIDNSKQKAVRGAWGLESSSPSKSTSRTTTSSESTKEKEKKPSVFWLLCKIAWVIYAAYVVIHDLYYIMYGTLVDSNGNIVESLGFWQYSYIVLGLIILNSVIKDIKKLMK